MEILSGCFPSTKGVRWFARRQTECPCSARILIAEDDMAMRVFLDRALSHSGHDASAVPSGESAARYVEN